MGRRWAAVVAVVGAAMAAAVLVDPLAFVADDSWFYLVIGRNVAEGHGITFSRVTPTNGFQPLWQAVVALTLTVARGLGITSPTGEMRAVLVVGSGLVALAAWRLDRLLRGFDAPPAVVAAAVLLVVVYLGGPLGTPASEANLVALLVVVAVSATVAIVTAPAPTPAAAGRLGVALGLLVLGRLDTGFVAVAALGAVAVGGVAARAVRLRTAVIAGTVAALVVGPYLAWNLVRFGHLLPIAGAIKLDRREVWLNPEAIGQTGWALFAGIAVAGAVAFAGRRPSRAEAVTFGVPLAGALVSSSIYLAWSPGRFTDLDWYRLPHLLALAVAAALAGRRIAAVAPRLPGLVVPAGVVLLVPVLGFVLVDRRIQGANHDFWHPVADFSTALAGRVPDDGVIATVDYPGVIAAFSGRRVVALDGLTGDYEFQDALRDDGAGCALAERGVRWLVVDDSDRLRPVEPDDPAAGYQVVVSSWLHRVDAGSLDLAPGDLVASATDTDLSLWRVDPRCR